MAAPEGLPTRPTTPTSGSASGSGAGSVPSEDDLSAGSMRFSLPAIPSPGHPRRFRALLEHLAAEYDQLALDRPQTSNLNLNFNLSSEGQSPCSEWGTTTSTLMMIPPGLPNKDDFKSTSMSTLVLSDSSGDITWTYAASPLRTILDRWQRFAEALLELHPESEFRLRDCWRREFSSRNLHDRSSTLGPLGLPDLFNDTVNGGRDIVERVWRPSKNPHFPGSHHRHLQHFRAGAAGVGGQQQPGSRCMLHPDGSKRMIWALMGLILIFLDVFFLTMAVFGMDRPTLVMLLDGLYWFVDIGVNFCIGMYEGDHLVMSRPVVAKHYLRTWFFPDTLLLLVNWLLAILDSGRPGAGLVRYIRLARFLRLVRLAKFNRNLRQLLLNQARWTNLLLKMGIYLLSVALWVHLSATFFFWIGDRPGGWTRQEPEFQTLPLSYLISVHWAASQLQGSIDVFPEYNTAERSFVVLNLLASVAVLAMVVSKVTNVLHAMQLANRDRNRVTLAARRFLERNDVRSELSLQIYRYLAKRELVKARMGDDEDESEMLHRLPLHLRRTLLQEARWPMVNRHILFVAFASSNDHFKQLLLCDVLQSSVYLPDDMIFQYEAACTRMYLVVFGECHYLRYGRTFVSLLANGTRPKRSPGKESPDWAAAFNAASIQEGDEDGNLESNTSSLAGSCNSFEGSDSISSFGEEFSAFRARHRQIQGCVVRRNTTLAEAGLWTNWVHAGDFEAVNETPIFHINVNEFEDLVSNFVKVQQDVRGHAHRFLEYLNQADGEKYSDMLSTDMVMNAAFAASKERFVSEAAAAAQASEGTETMVVESESFSINRRNTLISIDDDDPVSVKASHIFAEEDLSSKCPPRYPLRMGL